MVPSPTLPFRVALIVGAGPGISGSLARRLSAAGLRVGLAARSPAKLEGLAEETGAALFEADAGDPAAVARLFGEVEARLGAPDLVVYNASGRVRGPLAELDPEAVRSVMETTAFGAFLVVQQAVRRMLPQGPDTVGHGAILLTGASAGLKGFARSAPFAMGKFALRGLAQSAARELHPRGVHVAHMVIDGGVRSDTRPDEGDRTLDPDAIADAYLAVLAQPRSAWSDEVVLRPWVETF